MSEITKDYVNSLIENALDYDEWGIDNPYDPSLHSATQGQLVVAYYGTTKSEFWDVVTNGIDAGRTIGPRDAVGDHENKLSFVKSDAEHRAYNLVKDLVIRQSDTDPIVFVIEVPIQKKKVSREDPLEKFLSGTSVSAGMYSLLPEKIKPNRITGVCLDFSSHATPIKKAIAMAKKGRIEGIDPNKDFKSSKYRPYGPSRENWQIGLIKYIEDMLNYTSGYFDYLTYDTSLSRTAIIREATKLGWIAMHSWKGERVLEWYFSLLPPNPGYRDDPNPGYRDDESNQEKDIARAIESTSAAKYPLYLAMKFYKEDDLAYNSRKTGE